MSNGPGPRVEHRHLTVLFTDLVGSTRLTQTLEPEVFREILRDYVRAVRACVAKYDGYVARVVGDGVLVYFGWPAAREDAAECAINSAIDIHTALGDLSLTRQINLECRAAIATGSVIIGAEDEDDAAQMNDAFGEAPHLASRLQALAGPGETVVARETRDLADASFEFRPPFEAVLDGFSGSVQVHRLFRPRHMANEMQTRPRTIFGREEELAALSAAWAEAKQGRGAAISITGRAGIGKSGLIHGFRRAENIAPAATATYRCARLFADAAYHPFVESLNRWTGVRQGDPVAQRRRRLQTKLSPYLSDEQVQTVIGLATQTHEVGDQSESVSQYRYRNALQGAYIAIVRAMASQTPMLLHVENAHWCDPSSLQVVDAMIREIETLPVLLVLTGREAPVFPTGFTAPLRPMHLAPLDPVAGRQLIAEAAGDAPPDEALVERILMRSDGVPLFMQACMTAMAGAQAAASDVPTNLMDLLQEQLDQLGDLRGVAVAASVIGGAFDANMLAAVADITVGAARVAIAELLRRGVFRTEALEGENVYRFAQTMQRDTAYGVLISKDQVDLHTRVLSYAESAGNIVGSWTPEFRAYHYEGAGRLDAAASEWSKAARTALSRFAHDQALSHADRGLALVENAEGEDAKRARVALNAARGMALRALKGPGAQSSVIAMHSAFREAVEIGDSASILHVGRVLSVAHHVRAEYEAAERYASELEQALPDDALAQMIARLLLAMPMIWQGQFINARTELLAAYDMVAARRQGRTRTSFESQIISLNAVVEAFLGNVPKALDMAADGVDRAHATESPQVIASALMLSCNTHQIVLSDGTMASARALQQIGNEQRLPFYQASAASFVAAAYYNEGQVDRGFEQLKKGWEAFQATTSRANQMLVCRELARGCLMRGAYDEGLVYVDDGLERARIYQERNYLAEIFRLKGELLERSGADQAEVIRCYDYAIGVARRQEAALFERWAIENRLALGLADEDGLADRLTVLIASGQSSTDASNLRSDGTK